MSAPNPSAQNLHVNGPSEPQQTPAPNPIPMEDRQLTPEETESLLRGFEPEPEQPLSNADDPDQAQQAGDFFSQLPQQPKGQEAPAQQAPPQRTQEPPQPPPFHQQAAPQQPQQVPVQQVDPMLQALQAQNQLLQAEIQQIRQQMAHQPPTPGQQPAQQQTQPTQFDFNVPDQYLAALRSEDNNVVRAALNGLLSGVANSVAQQVRQEQEQFRTSLQPQLDQRFQTYTKAQEVNQDMFGTYPELRPYREYVRTAATQVAGNLGIDAWNADVRDAIAERLAPLVPGLMQRVQQNRAQRMSQQMAPPGGQFPQQQALPQGQGYAQAPQPMHPLQQAVQQPVQGVHGGPVYVRDAAGNLVPYQPQQQFVAGQHARPAGQQVDPRLQDIWSTLGYQ